MTAAGAIPPEAPAPRADPITDGSQPPPPVPSIGVQLLVASLLSVVALFVVFSPWPLEAKLHSIGRACCAQIPSHTITIAGQPMPIDARNSGIYLGVFLVIAILWLTGRQRAAVMAPPQIRTLLFVFTLTMIVDGFNSLGHTEHLRTFYPESNTIRTITGAFAGMSLTMLVVPVFNRLVWRQPEPIAIVEDFMELTGYLVAVVLVILSLLQAPASLYWPLSTLSIAGLLITLTMVNTCTLLVSLRRERSVGSERGLFVPALAGLTITCFEILAISLWRSTGHG